MSKELSICEVPSELCTEIINHPDFNLDIDLVLGYDEMAEKSGKNRSIIFSKRETIVYVMYN